MSAVDWFRLAFIAIATAFCINEARKLLAPPKELDRLTSSIDGLKEGDHGPEEHDAR